MLERLYGNKATISRTILDHVCSKAQKNSTHPSSIQLYEHILQRCPMNGILVEGKLNSIFLLCDISMKQQPSNTDFETSELQFLQNIAISSALLISTLLPHNEGLRKHFISFTQR
ncbi:uncharacterized protein PHALS_15057 [Plasmopara halstedii]|uniref:Uncharacterized protein n=1 Tax=Plasmopara halstedii TaxID=4781 RepID=A0A0N7L7Q5_PLAHL|nr:uncharacterized protein PHALS_15057 [Plasmopara halstedii]CEG47731.1 hypothetical protein PHALS_15057 [Plasmopara halstedii]|eukprot:XP_024584100.1 hypothetical protein PHALS_15057 [Plasmopara halstedii]